MNKPFSSIEFKAKQSPYIKALYFAFGHNAMLNRVGDKTLSGLLYVDAIKFAEAYADHCSHDGSHINVNDCLAMFFNGQKEFKR